MEHWKRQKDDPPLTHAIARMIQDAKRGMGIWCSCGWNYQALNEEKMREYEVNDYLIDMQRVHAHDMELRGL